MDTVQDFEDLLELLERFAARYLIIGGLAFIYHAKPGQEPVPTHSVKSLNRAPPVAVQALTANGTVAIKPGHPHLNCGARIFVEGVGVRTVTDRGGGLVEKQLDHYVGVSGCNAPSSIGYQMTFALR